jgi:hypothetical protein
MNGIQILLKKGKYVLRMFLLHFSYLGYKGSIVFPDTWHLLFPYLGCMLILWQKWLPGR